MQLARNFLAIALTFSLISISTLTLAIPIAAQDSKIALQRGYRTGYSDGYMSGYRDGIENSAKKYRRHNEYKTADRAFSSDYGKIADYSDGYRQGFEKGYDTGFSKLDFDATIPADLKFRGTPLNASPDGKPAQASTKKELDSATSPPEAKIDARIPNDNAAKITDVALKNPAADKTNPDSDENVNPDPTSTSPTTKFADDEIIIIPAETELLIELLDEMDTRVIREGDKFKARVVSPVEIAGAIIEGRVAKNRRPGRLKRRAELILSFDRIKLSETRWSNFNAIIVDVLPVKGDNVKRVDNEGLVQGKRPYKSDSIKVGASTGTAVIIGAIIGGPVGAAVGAGIGAAFGVGAVVVERGKFMKLAERQQMRIKTAYETRIR